MSWVCANCTTENDDGVVKCVVCGGNHSPKTNVGDEGEGKVFFSGFDAFKYNLKKLFGRNSDSE